MSKVALTIPNYSSNELKKLLRKDEKFQQGIRLYACYQVSIGKRPKDLEEVYGVTFKSICNWVHRLNEGGVEALVDKVRPGRTKRLTVEISAKIRQVVLHESPSEYGFNSATWTGPLLIEWLKKEFNVAYKKAQIYNILKELGLSFQKGKGIYPESQEREGAVEELKKTPSSKGKR